MQSMNNTVSWFLLAAAGAAAVVAVAPASGRPLAAPSACHAREVAAAAPAPEVAVGTAVAASSTSVATVAAPAAVGTTTFPDGSTRPALNGAVGELKMTWPGGGAFSPVVLLREHQGTQWYQHADGSMSTTLVRTDARTGKVYNLPVCYRPAPVVERR
jgi:hypothetical protein